MVKPNDQSNSDSGRKRRAVAKRGPKPVRADRVNTRALVLEATWRRLSTHGYAQLNLRDIALEAGVNHALINYHFKSKQALVLEVLDETDRRLLERQSKMYATPLKPSEKWQQACDFYDEDVRTGYVRVLQELTAASYSDETLRREFLPRVLAWHQLVTQAVVETVDGYHLDLPVTPQVIGTWISVFWAGMESMTMAGVTEEKIPFRKALAAVTDLLLMMEAKRTDNARAQESGNASARTTLRRRA